jgi:2-dehydro-3-deoxygluconokinase
VATALARWGIPAAYGTALPDHYLSHEIIQYLQQQKVDTAPVHFCGTRIGAYYLPQGGDLKSSGVIYDRAGSSFSELKPGVLDWDKLLQNKSWFHFSAISPALNAGVAAVCREGLESAVRNGLSISVDLNYRAKLWQYGKKPVEVMPDLVQHCQLVMGNIWAAEAMLGIGLPENLEKNKSSLLQQAEATARAIRQQFPKCSSTAFTFRFNEENGLRYYASLQNKKGQWVSREYETASITDQVGSGDCFMAGLIYGACHNWEAQQTIDFAAAAAFSKLFIKGDSTTATVEQIKNICLTHA